MNWCNDLCIFVSSGQIFKGTRFLWGSKDQRQKGSNSSQSESLCVLLQLPVKESSGL